MNDSLILRSDSRKWIGYLALALAGSGVGMILIVRGIGLLGWPLFVIFDALAIFAFLALLPYSSYLLLTPKRIVFRNVLQARAFEWENIDEIKVIETAKGEKAGFDYSGKRILLPSNYGLSADELVHVLDLWKTKWEEEN